MNNLSINVIDDVIASNYIKSKDFQEYCSDLEQIHAIYDIDLYLEEVKHKETVLKQKVSGIVKGTMKTTADVGKAYDDITTAGGAIIKGQWDVTMSGIGLITRILRFLVTRISRIPNMIVNVINKIGDIPSDIKNKIRGNIKLYITINDISDLYNRSLLLKLHNFIDLSKLLSEGEMWSTLFNNKNTGDGTTFQIKENDMTLCKKLKKEYNSFSMLEFKPSVVEMNDIDTVNAYFGSSKSVKFTDLHGKLHECTYYEALSQLVKDIQENEEELKKLRSTIGDKFSASQANQSFAKMGPLAQHHVTNAIQMVAKSVEIVGNIIRYIMIDINTMENTINKLLEKRGIAPNNELVKNANKQNTDANKRSKKE